MEFADVLKNLGHESAKAADVDGSGDIGFDGFVRITS